MSAGASRAARRHHAAREARSVIRTGRQMGGRRIVTAEAMPDLLSPDAVPPAM